MDFLDLRNSPYGCDRRSIRQEPPLGMVARSLLVATDLGPELLLIPKSEAVLGYRGIDPDLCFPFTFAFFPPFHAECRRLQEP